MDKMTRGRRDVKPRTADNWPAWTDDYRFTPTEDDFAANAQANESWDDSHPPSDHPAWQEWADEATAIERHESGLTDY